MITERIKYYIQHYQQYGFKRFIRYIFREIPFFYRVEDNIYIGWTLPSLFVIKIGDVIRINRYKSLWFKLFVSVRNYQGHSSCYVLYALFLVYPFIELYYILNKGYYKWAVWFFKKGYLKVEEGTLISRLWFIDLIRTLLQRSR